MDVVVVVVVDVDVETWKVATLVEAWKRRDKNDRVRDDGSSGR